MSVGMTKFYRVACFQQIGGFVREVMWDGIDCHRCRMLGWIACSWDDESDLRFLHLRPMGSSQTGILTGRMRHGFGQYFMGTSFPYMSASALLRMLHPPYVLGGMAIAIGALVEGAAADLVVFDADLPWRVDTTHMQSSAGNTPFDELPVQGKVIHTIKGGHPPE